MTITDEDIRMVANAQTDMTRGNILRRYTSNVSDMTMKQKR
jgi:hypothetical protein